MRRALLNRDPRLLRLSEDRPDAHNKVTFIELFFDLVFVFATTQLSHFLLDHFSALVALQTLILLLAVWWVWIFTTWVSNWLDPEQVPVRLMLLALMFLGLLLSSSLPHAFGSLGLVFALAYVGMQVGRTLFAIWALHAHHEELSRNFQRMLAWLALAALLWINGALQQDPTARMLYWGAALLIEYLSPSTGFWVPRLGRSSTRVWNVEGEHMAERCGLFIIIALGESVLVTGAHFSEGDWSATSVAALTVAFVSTVIMWWLYFDVGAAHGSRRLAQARNPGRLARLAYTYLHLPIVAGIIVCAVADEAVLEHPLGHTDIRATVTILGGNALYLLGIMLFKWAVAGRLPAAHVVALGALLGLVPLVAQLTPLLLAGAGTLVLFLLAAWEHYNAWRCFRRPPEIDPES
ncbi:MAG: putative rane protein [Moraxellaceae bacterium]|jgi:low temperature requirement protein LtrA|nr:putative rane protein [Moraxellaceae bacterium]